MRLLVPPSRITTHHLRAAMSDSNLRPLTLPSLSPTLTRLSALKSQITLLHSQVDQYSKLALKLETFTDEPTWNAYVSLCTHHEHEELS
jgi:hypothetical protein